MCLICLKAYNENFPRASKLISDSRVVKNLACLFVVLFLVCLGLGLGLVGWGFLQYIFYRSTRRDILYLLFPCYHTFSVFFFNPYLNSVQINFEVIFAFFTES